MLALSIIMWPSGLRTEIRRDLGMNVLFWRNSTYLKK